MILVSLALFLTASPIRSAGPETARGLLDQAIKAMGGADALARTRTLIRSAKGEITFGGVAVPFVGEQTLRFPDQARFAFELGEGQKLRLVFVVNGDKGWQLSTGATKDLSQLELDQFREELYAHQVMTLLPLREKPFDLTLLPETRLGDRPVVGLKVSNRGHADIKLYFDKASLLLVKLERKVREAGVETEKETYFGEPKEFDGIKLPTRIVERSSGKKSADLTVTEYRFPNRVDDKLFSKP
jgi:hypothetical protein